MLKNREALIEVLKTHLSFLKDKLFLFDPVTKKEEFLFYKYIEFINEVPYELNSFNVILYYESTYEEFYCLNPLLDPIGFFNKLDFQFNSIKNKSVLRIEIQYLDRFKNVYIA